MDDVVFYVMGIYISKLETGSDRGKRNIYMFCWEMGCTIGEIIEREFHVDLGVVGNVIGNGVLWRVRMMRSSSELNNVVVMKRVVAYELYRVKAPKHDVDGKYACEG